MICDQLLEYVRKDRLLTKGCAGSNANCVKSTSNSGGRGTRGGISESSGTSASEDDANGEDGAGVVDAGVEGPDSGAGVEAAVLDLVRREDGCELAARTRRCAG